MTASLRHALTRCALVVLLSAGIGIGSGTIPAASAAQCGSWSIAASANVGGGNASILNGVAAATASDAWAVGYSGSLPGQSATLTEHWNGTGWTIVASPNAIAGGDNQFNDVAAVPGTHRFWAVGYASDNTGHDQTLAEQWYGTSWRIVPSPNPSAANNHLDAVTALAPGDVWAVGDATGNVVLTEHWNGSAWSAVPTPAPSGMLPFLTGVAGASSRDVWAVGGAFNPSTGANQILIEHWDGTAWSIVSAPAPFGQSPTLSDVTALSANNVWAVGGETDPSTGAGRTFFEHWSGTTWSVVYGSGTAGGAIAAVSAINIWALAGDMQAAHWNGTTWHLVSLPSQPTGFNQLRDIARVPGTSQLWAVGDYYKNSIPHTLTEFRC